MWRAARRDRSLTVTASLYAAGWARTCLPCRPPSTERCLVFCSPVLAPSAFVSSGRLFETGAAGAGEAAGSAIVVMAHVAVRGREGLGGTQGGAGSGIITLAALFFISGKEQEGPTRLQDVPANQRTTNYGTM